MSEHDTRRSRITRPRGRTPLPLLPRRDALKGLGVLAVSSSALGMSGCSDGGNEAASAATAAGTPASAPQSAAGASAGGSPAKPTASSPTASAPPPAATSSSAGAGSAATGGSAAASAGGSPAVASSAGGGAAGTSGGSGAGGSTASTGAAGGGAAATGAAGSSGLESLACIMSPAMTDGPFFVDEKLNRSDLVKGETDEAITKAVPLELTLGVYAVNGMSCSPASGLQVDIWHANALGIYSDVRSGAVQSTDTQGKQFLRAYQVTNEAGVVKFSTIYPGWYPSRTIHIHVKVRMPMGSTRGYDFTSQIFFDEAISSAVLAQAPYNKTPGMRSILNDGDHIYNGTASNAQKPPAGKTAPGAQTTAVLTKTATGYAAVLKLGIRV